MLTRCFTALFLVFSVLFITGCKDTPPELTISATELTVQQGKSVSLSWSAKNATVVHIDNGIGNVSTNGSVSLSPVNTTTYTITAGGAGGTVSKTVLVRVTSAVTPPAEGSFGGNYTEFIPDDATIDEYDEERFALVTGLVHNIDAQPLADVLITIKDYPEYGSARTDESGRFTLPVEGGGMLRVIYQKQGYITAHRKVETTGNNVASAATPVLIQEDTKSTSVIFDGNAENVVTHTATPVTDEFGTRATTLVFKGDNTAWAVDENGERIHELPNINVRATEFTTQKSMPAVLPPNTAYTFCAELTVDGVERVEFEKPVAMWVENFLSFPQGSVVPVGYYDRDVGEWIPANNGIVVTLLDTTGDGKVDGLDTTGDGQPNDLNGDGSFTDEVTGVEHFTPDTSYWRVEIDHFTPWDCNWPYGPAPDAPWPNPEGPGCGDRCPKETQANSYIENKTQTYHEDIAVPGTDITLHYNSRLAPGYTANVVKMPVTGNEAFHEDLLEIKVHLRYMGHHFVETYAPANNITTVFNLPEQDAWNKDITYSSTASAEIEYVYKAVYLTPSEFAEAFNAPGGEPLQTTGDRARQTVSKWRKHEVAILPNLSAVGKDNKYTLASGWTLSNQHFLDPVNKNLVLLGSGSLKEGKVKSGFIQEPFTDYAGRIFKIAVDSRDNIILLTPNDNNDAYAIRKVTVDGTVTTIAEGTTLSPFNKNLPDNYYVENFHHNTADGSLFKVADIAVGPNDNIYYLTWGGHSGSHVYKIDNSGTPARVVQDAYTSDTYIDMGTYSAGVSLLVTHSGLIATCATRINVYSASGQPIATGPENHLQTNAWACSTDRLDNFYNGNPVSYPPLYTMHQHSVDLTLAHKFKARLIAGDRYTSEVKDHVPATETALQRHFSAPVFDKVGNAYFFDGYTRLRKIDPTGIISTLGYADHEVNPRQVYGERLYNLAMDSQNNIYYLQDTSAYKLSFKSAFTTFLSDDDQIRHAVPSGNDLTYIFDQSGRHVETQHISGKVIKTFAYNADGYLISMTDAFGNVTRIERDGTGNPTAIVSPYGHRTSLTVDASGDLTGISFEHGGRYSFTYRDGLQLTKTDPQGNVSTKTYDDKGLLERFTDQEGGSQSLAKPTPANGADTVTTITSGEGNVTKHIETKLTSQAYDYSTVTVAPTGEETVFKESEDKNRFLSEACGMTSVREYTPDPVTKRIVASSNTVTTPAGLTQKTTESHTETAHDTIPMAVQKKQSIHSINGKESTTVTDYVTGVITSTTPENRVYTSLFDPDTLLTTKIETPGVLAAEFGYDARGRIVSTTVGDRQSLVSYDNRGNMATETDPLGRVSTYTYDVMDRVVREEAPDGSVVRYTYDNNGNMTRLVTPIGGEYSFTYNGVNNPKAETDPLNGTTRYAYDTDQNLTGVTLPSGKVITNIYTNGRLAQVDTPDWSAYYTWDCGSNPARIARDSEALSFTWDGALMTGMHQTGTVNQNIGLTYNNDFMVTGMTYAGGTESITYDNDGLPTGIGRFSIGRNAKSGLPVQVSDGSLAVNRVFSPYGEVSSTDYSLAGSAMKWQVQRNKLGLITQKTETVNSVAVQYNYAYDDFGRLLTVSQNGMQVEAYVYDANGNRQSEVNTHLGVNRTYTHNLEDQTTKAGSITYHYNDDDFLAKKVDGADVTTYDYSSMGELKSVTLPDGMVVTYTHDVLTRPVAKSIDGSIVEKYLWNGRTQLLAVLEPDNSVRQRFVYVDDRLPYAMEMGGSTYYLAYDQVGSLRIITDSSGNVVKEVRYDTFGNIIEDSNPGFEIPFGFAGGLHDVDTGLVRFGYRDYAPEIGRWTAKDPIGFAGGDSNLYGYVFSDPVNFVDPEGLWTVSNRFNVSILGYDVTFAYVVDDCGNKAIQFTLGVGFTPGASVTVGSTTTTANTVNDLEKWGVTGGGSVGEGVMGEVNGVSGDGYGGVDTGIGGGAQIWPTLPQGFITYTWTLFQW